MLQVQAHRARWTTLSSSCIRTCLACLEHGDAAPKDAPCSLYNRATLNGSCSVCRFTPMSAFILSTTGRSTSAAIPPSSLVRASAATSLAHILAGRVQDSLSQVSQVRGLSLMCTIRVQTAKGGCPAGSEHASARGLLCFFAQCTNITLSCKQHLQVSLCSWTVHGMA